MVTSLVLLGFTGCSLLPCLGFTAFCGYVRWLGYHRRFLSIENRHEFGLLGANLRGGGEGLKKGGGGQQSRANKSREQQLLAGLQKFFIPVFLTGTKQAALTEWAD